MLFRPRREVGRRSIEVVRGKLACLTPGSPEDSAGHRARDGNAGYDVHHSVCIRICQDVDEQRRNEKEELDDEKGCRLLNQHGFDVFSVQIVAIGRKDAPEKATPAGFVEPANGKDETKQVEEQERAKDSDNIETVEVPRAEIGGGKLVAVAHDGKKDGKGYDQEPGCDDQRDDSLPHVPDGAGSEAKDEHSCADPNAE